MAKKIEIDYIKSFRLCDEKHFLIMKGIAILLVILAYVSKAFFEMEELMPLAGVGSVIFLFCSGYGVSESYLWKNGFPHYWENKVIKIWIPSVVSLVLFSLINGGTGINWIEQTPLGLSGWFLYVLLVFYLLFWLAFEYIENKATALLAITVVAAIAFAVLKDQTYTEVLLAFPLGAAASQYGLKRVLRQWNTPKRLLFCGLMLAVAAGGYFLAGIAVAPLLCNLCWLLSKTAMGICLIYGVFCLQKIPVFGLFGLLGGISYGLYLLTMPLMSLISTPMEPESVGIGLLVLVVAAAVYNWLFDQLCAWNKRARRKKNPPLKGNMQR